MLVYAVCTLCALSHLCDNRAMTTPTCSFLSSASHHARAAIRCDQPGNHTVQDRRPLPDGKLRPAMPACAEHATAMLKTGNYAVSFELLVIS
jgi:hypothetical protein